MWRFQSVLCWLQGKQQHFLAAENNEEQRGSSCSVHQASLPVSAPALHCEEGSSSTAAAKMKLLQRPGLLQGSRAGQDTIFLNSFHTVFVLSHSGVVHRALGWNQSQPWVGPMTSQGRLPTSCRTRFPQPGAQQLSLS